MKILVLAPYSDNDWSNNDTHESEMDGLIKNSVNTLAKKGHDLTVCIRKSRESNASQTQQNPKLIFIEAGPPKKLGYIDTCQVLEKSVLPAELLSKVDLIIAHHWLSKPWIYQVAKKYHGRILYFSHSFSLKPSKEFNENIQLKSEMSLINRVTWCTFNESEFSTLSEILPENRIFYLDKPEVQAEDNLETTLTETKKKKVEFISNENAWTAWEREVTRIAMLPDKLIKTKLLEVSVTPKKINSHVVWFERVTLPASVHVLIENSDGSYEFIIEDRPQENIENKLRVLSGVIDESEDPTQAAHRELLEETGLRVKNMELFWHSHTEGLVDDHRYYFIAKNIISKEKATPESTELIKGMVSLHKEDILKHVKEGHFSNSLTCIALLKLCNILPTNRPKYGN